MKGFEGKVGASPASTKLQGGFGPLGFGGFRGIWFIWGLGLWANLGFVPSSFQICRFRIIAGGLWAS